MIGIRLFLRSRRVLAAAAVVVMAQAAGLVVGASEFRTSSYTELAVPWVVFLPLISSVAVGVSLRTPFPEVDGSAVRALAWYRTAQAAALGSIALLGTIGMTQHLNGPIGMTAAVRNLAGFTGLALVSAALVGARLSWLLPVASAMTAMTIGSPVNTGFAWDWPVRVDHDYSASVTAFILLVAGAIAIFRGGPREVNRDR